MQLFSYIDIYQLPTYISEMCLFVCGDGADGNHPQFHSYSIPLSVMSRAGPKGTFVLPNREFLQVHEQAVVVSRSLVGCHVTVGIDRKLPRPHFC